MNNKSNLVGLGVMAASAVVLIAVSNPLYNAIKDAQLKNAAGGEEVWCQQVDGT